MSEYTLVSSITDDPNKKIYRMIKPSHPYVGFCGYLWQVIRAIHKYPNDKYYIYVGNSAVQNSPNVWDFYFKQPHTDTPPKSEEIISEVGILFDESSEFVNSYPCMKKMPPEERQQRREELSNIVTKYFHLLPEIQGKIDAFKASHFTGKKIMGLHCRATDHPDKRDISYSFPEIDILIDKYDITFASSDENFIMDTLRKRYANKIVFYESTTRSDPGDFQMPRTENSEPTHAFRYNALINWSKENSGYKIGEDTIVETYLLASTNFLLCTCASNVNYFIRVVNGKLPYHVIYAPDL